MAPKKIYGFDQAGVRRIREATRQVLGSPRVGAQRRRQSPVMGDGACKCEEIHRFWTNGPTAGTFDATYLVNAVSETVTWDFDTSAADAQTALEGHSEIGSGNVEVWGGPWPFVSLYVKFKGDLKATSIPFPTIDNSSLTNGAGFMDKYSYV